MFNPEDLHTLESRPCPQRAHSTEHGPAPRRQEVFLELIMKSSHEIMFFSEQRLSSHKRFFTNQLRIMSALLCRRDSTCNRRSRAPCLPLELVIRICSAAKTQGHTERRGLCLAGGGKYGPSSDRRQVISMSRFCAP